MPCLSGLDSSQPDVGQMNGGLESVLFKVLSLSFQESTQLIHVSSSRHSPFTNPSSLSCGRPFVSKDLTKYYKVRFTSRQG